MDSEYFSKSSVVSVTKEKKTIPPPKLYDLTMLQKDANRLFSFTAKQTLEYTQSLYEKKLVTYPRTVCEAESMSLYIIWKRSWCIDINCIIPIICFIHITTPFIKNIVL